MTVLGVGIETAILTDCYHYVGEPVIMVLGDYYSTVEMIFFLFLKTTEAQV